MAAMAWAEGHDADILLLPELAITGYPPEDLLLRPGFIDDNLAALERITEASGNTVTVVGFVDRVASDHHPDDSVPRSLANAAALIGNGKRLGTYHKALLPNYGVFDEARYFVPGPEVDQVWTVGEVNCGVSVCEDIWSPDGPPTQQAKAGAEILLNINGSPYHLGKGEERAELLAAQARASGVPVVYLNLVGGQDELVFDGESMVFDATGQLIYRAPQFKEELFHVDIEIGRDQPTDDVRPRLSVEGEVYAALVTGLGDYVRKNGFTEVVIGLSGGIDSALTCAIAVDALGPQAVWGVTMPTRYSSDGSIADSRELAANLGCRFDMIPIDDVFAQFLTSLAPQFADTDPDVTEENLQARIRGAILMALSNKFGSMVVATGNKSEMAVGYATLYGDMAGGFAVLKDVFKTWVYKLAVWRNRDGVVIPVATIEKPPSAELRPGQLDSDSLPDYDTLDGILEMYVEQDQAVKEIVDGGFPPTVVARVAGLVDRNEYKRRQAAPGVRITAKAFGKDRRIPITNGY
jgi:NAD+ synthase (glutamine-hydrolysing)